MPLPAWLLPASTPTQTNGALLVFSQRDVTVTEYVECAGTVTRVDDEPQRTAPVTHIY
jgi:hypothetical protein